MHATLLKAWRKNRTMKFYYKDLILEIPSSVYYPREDSLLMAKTLENADFRNKKCLDMGCGSGLLAIIMAKNNDVTAVDINKEAVRATIANANKCEVKLKAFFSDLFSFIKDSYDLIVFNSPYLPVPDDKDITYSGGRTGREVIGRFISQVKACLNKDGRVLLLISSLTGEKTVLDAFSNNNFSARTIAREKVPWEELIVIEARNTS